MENEVGKTVKIQSKNSKQIIKNLLIIGQNQLNEKDIEYVFKMIKFL